MRRQRLAIGVVLALATVATAACTERSPSASYVIEDCTRADLGGRSVARVWNEVLLDAIRRDVPAPTTHARNLFHVSAAMWDAWAAYDPVADGHFVHEKVDAGAGAGAGDDGVLGAREAAISYAAYRVLLWRYSRAAGLQETFDQLRATMASLCYAVDAVGTDGDSPAALGNRIAAAVIERGSDDGSREDTRYVDTAYRPVNRPMVVTERAVDVVDPGRWQPLALDRVVAQNGLPIPGSVQRYIGPHWGHVEGFALAPADDGVPVDPGPPPGAGDPGGAFAAAALDVVRMSSELDPGDGVVIDVGPGAAGDNPLGTDAGDGHPVNPATGEPYEPNRVLRGDYARVIAQFWADGPASETPPGHWNAIANDVTGSPGFERRVGGDGPELGPLEWDVKLYFALNGAVHDAAVAAWGVKRRYDSARPISMIRYLGSRGQASDPAAPSFDPDGLPLEPGLVEVVTEASSAPGQRHAHLAGHRGEVAVRAWAGNPEGPGHEAAGTEWGLAVDWVPFQLPTFVTPAFAGYVSGHSTFSRAAAEVLAAMTGSAYFPGGLAEWTVPAGSLAVEEGPSRDVVLQAATYYDAADQAGVSRLYGGIHIRADDLAGRRIGSACGIDAWALARRHFAGTAPGGTGPG